MNLTLLKLGLYICYRLDWPFFMLVFIAVVCFSFSIEPSTLSSSGFLNLPIISTIVARVCYSFRSLFSIVKIVSTFNNLESIQSPVLSVVLFLRLVHVADVGVLNPLHHIKHFWVSKYSQAHNAM